MRTFKDKNERAGLVTTIMVHLGLFLIFLLTGLTYLEPPPPEEGITINFGTSNSGMGKIQPESVVNQQNLQNEDFSESAQSAASAVNAADVTQDIEESVAMTSEPKTQQTVEEVEPDPEPDDELVNLLEKWSKSGGSKTGSEGETGEPGDQGAEHGDKNSNSRVGSGSGNGFKWNLAGRSINRKPVIRDDSQEEGRVVVDIIVNRRGEVIRATPGAKGSTTTSSYLYRLAKEAAMKTKFDAKPDAAPQQKGQIVFNFLVQG